MATLRSFASEPGRRRRRLSDGKLVEVERWTIRFPWAEPNRLPKDVLRKTYAVKPLVAPFGRGLFGKLAILQCLEREDGSLDRLVPWFRTLLARHAARILAG